MGEAIKCANPLEFSAKDIEEYLKKIADELSPSDLVNTVLVMSDVIEILLHIVGAFASSLMEQSGVDSAEKTYKSLHEYVTSLVKTINESFDKSEEIRFSNSETIQLLTQKLMDELEDMIMSYYDKGEKTKEC